jgi:hypothetical protein
LARGQVGTIVEQLDGKTFLVEFSVAPIAVAP